MTLEDTCFVAILLVLGAAALMMLILFASPIPSSSGNLDIWEILPSTLDL